MVGLGGLRQCLRDPEVEQVISIVRAPSGTTHEELREVVHRNFLDFTPVKNELTGLNARLYRLGATSAERKKKSMRASPMNLRSLRREPC